MKGNLADAVSRLISPGAGKIVKSTKGDKQFIAKYAKEIAALPSETRHLAFKNIIVPEGKCGFAMAGREDYLINTDAHGRYRVTVRTHWQQGPNGGEYDSIYDMEAGGKRFVGCTKSGSTPVATYSHWVVGESPL